MRNTTLSRGPEIDRELCCSKMGTGMYDLVLAATARAREIRRQHRSSESYEHIYPIVTAILEIQQGKIDPKEYLKRVK